MFPYCSPTGGVATRDLRRAGRHRRQAAASRVTSAPKDQLVYKRRTGKFSLQIVGHPDFGLPLGRIDSFPFALLPSPCGKRTAQSISTAPPRFWTSFGFGRMADISVGSRKVFNESLLQLSSSARKSTQPEVICSTGPGFHFFDHVHFWFTKGSKRCSSSAGEHLITLSEEFYNEIGQHYVPMEKEVVIALANSPDVLDFYVWLAWKSWGLKGVKTSIPLFAAGGLREQLGCRIHPEDRFLRRKINQWLRVIRAYWPQCPAKISADGQSLIIFSSKPSPALHPVGRSGKGPSLGCCLTEVRLHCIFIVDTVKGEKDANHTARKVG